MSSLKLKTYYCSILFIAFLGFQQPVNAQSISGRLTTAFYSWQAPESVDNSTSYFRGYQGLVLHAKNLGSPKVSFHTGLRIFEDIGSGIDNNSDHRMYNFYLKARQVGGVADIKIGRQQIFSGVAFGTIDGAFISFKIPKYARLEVFGGSLVPLRETWKINGWNDGNLWGSRLAVDRWDNTHVSVSYMRRSRKPLEYKTSGQYTQRKWDISALQQHLLGIDGEQIISRQLKVYGRLEGDMEYGRFDRGEGIVQYTPVPNFTVTGEYFYRKPRMYYNSLFSYFTQMDNQEVWLRANYRFRGRWFVHGGIATVRYEGEESSNRFNTGIGSEYFSIGYNRRSGFSGALDGLYANVQYPVREKIWLRGGTFISRYKLYEEQEEYDDLVTSFGGVKYVPVHWFSLDVEGQGLKNKLFSSDFRLFVRGNFWLFAK